MEHELFRYLSPGICFITPIYLAACWAVLNSEKGSSLREFILIGGSATVPALAVPFGWYVYNAFRAFRHLTTTSYEEKPFVKLIREGLHTVYDSSNQSYYIDFTCISKEVGWRSFSEDAFLVVFHPFRKGRSAHLRELQRGRVNFGYLEPVSDLLLWTNSTYDYARSISSVRYGIDSSVFAFLFGICLAISSLGILSYFVSDPPFLLLNRLPPVFWWLLFLLPSLLLAVLVVLRRKQAATEYSARLTLITMFSSEASRVSTLASDRKLPADVLSVLARITENDQQFAAFDMDNTLLCGDVGEAVFAKLLIAQKIKSPTWHQYQEKITQDRRDAYISIVEAMHGLSVEEVVEATLDVLSTPEPFIEVEGRRVPTPKPNPIMQALIISLRLRRIDVYVVTASNQISAEVAAWRWLGIPANCVLGVRSVIRGQGSERQVLGAVSEPVPYGEGKVELLRAEVGNARPFLTAGDSDQDIPMLQHTAPDGLIIWVDESSARLAQLKKQYFADRKLILVERALSA